MAGKAAKTAGKSSSSDHLNPSELSQLELEIQAHKDATAARFEEMQASFQKSLDANLLSFQSILAEQFQKHVSCVRLDGNKLVLTNSEPAGSAAITQPDGSVRFGSVLASTRGVIPTVDSSSSSVLARSEGIISTGPIDSDSTSNDVFMSLDHLSISNNPILGPGTSTVMVSGVNSTVDMSMVFGSKKQSGVSSMVNSGIQQTEVSQPQMFVSGSVLGAPPTLGLTQSFPSHHTIYAPNSIQNSQDMFSMSYTGPYTALSNNLGSSSVPSHSFTPNYIHQQTFVNATTTTTHPLSPKTSVNNSAHFHLQNPPHYIANQYQQQTYNSHQSHFDPNLPTMKQMRLDFGNYGGGDPVEWLNKCEQFFEFYQIPEERKLSIASMHLTDKASDRWYMFRHEFPPTWQGLADLLMREFSNYNRAECHAALARMNQTGSVEQFMEQFTKLSRRTPGISQEWLVYFFIGGLKEDIRADVQALKPRSLYEACELARVYETRNANMKHFARHSVTSNSGYNSNSFSASKPIQVPSYQIKAPSSAPTSQSNVRLKLTDAEFEARRAKKQCYFCDAAYVPGHNCRKKGQLMCLEIVPDEGELMQHGDVNQDNEVPPITDLDEPLIRLHIMSDDSNAQTMQLKGLFGGKVVHVLIDSGATHNFVHPQLLKGTKFPVHYFAPLSVSLASGARMQTKGEVTASLEMQGFVCTNDFYILPVTGCEVVLGATWLKTLGDILWNFETMKMKFRVSQQEFCLQGEQSVEVKAIGCKSMTRLLRKEREAMLIQVQSVAVVQKGGSPSEDIAQLIDKYAHFMPLSHPYTAAGVAQVFIQNIYKLHGLPETIISDRDPVFLSLFWEAFFKEQGTALHKSSAYHPQTDGQTENLNRTLEQYLRCVVGEKPKTWVDALPWAEYWYNTAHQSAIGMSPFKALYGYDPRPVQAYIPGSTTVKSVDQALRTRDELLAILKRNLQVAQARMKQAYDRKHTERVFAGGDWVYLKLQPYKQQSVKRRGNHKLSPRYYGPYQVEQRVGEVACKLKLPPSARVHNVFHVSLLKKKVGDSAVVAAHFPSDIDPHNPRWYPAAILDRQIWKLNDAPVTKWLVQWLGASVEEATWETAEEIKHRFPDFQAAEEIKHRFPDFQA